ncbi:carbonic anhydrase 1-like [Vanessa atalanta]|uniref:carbonic anhydrase 1-like n=1 Tax=Vanessa atalanta TaxID=42275 RepID=UPI001FCD1BC6|nr:carbonic anhydrase 1-like [Vanessa atalanta]
MFVEKVYIIVVFYIDLFSCISFYGPIWSYRDESAWPGGFCKKGGKRQSPIDIRTNNVIKDFDRQFITNGRLKFIGYENVLSSGINNGHTVQFSTEGDPDMHPTITGGPLKYTYRLEQLHFHWLSEHSINGAKFPMELHFVHVRADLNVSTALSKKDGLAILSVFCNVQPELNEDQREASEQIMQHIPLLMRTGRRVSGVILNLRKLLSPKINSYFTYLGSLTSPECNEVVVWIIFNNPIYISDAHYHLFGKVGKGRHNFRSQQKINNHQVFQPPDAFITTPKAVIIVTDVFKHVTQFFQNITRFVVRGFKSRN